MLVNAFYAAFEDRIVTFNRVRGDDRALLAIGEAEYGRIAHVLIAFVVHGVMAGEVLANLIVPAALIGIDRGFVVHIGAHNLVNLGHRTRVDMEATGGTATRDERPHALST